MLRLKTDNTITTDTFYSNFFARFFVLVVQNVLAISVNLLDNIMLGSYSEAALSGAAVVNQIQFVFQMMVVALGDGAVIICSQYWGKGNVANMKKIISTAVRSAFVIGLLLMLATSLFPHQILGVFTPSEVIVGSACDYLSIIRFTYPLFALTTVYLAAMRGAETVHIVFPLSIMTLVVNCGLNYMLIFGNFGAPELGIKGAAIGTLCARILELTVLLLYVRFCDKKLSLRPRDLLVTDRLLTKDYMKISAPILVVQLSWGINVALQTVLFGHMTDAAIVANSIAATLFLLVKAAVTGASSTSAIFIGKAIGIGNLDTVKLYASRIQRISLAIGVIGAAALYMIRIPILKLYNLSPEALTMANQFIIVMSVLFIAVAYQVPTCTGIIRGGGDALFVLKADIFSIWLCSIPLSFILAFVFKVSPAIVLFTLNVDQLIKCVLGYIKVHRGNWIHVLTR